MISVHLIYLAKSKHTHLTTFLIHNDGITTMPNTQLISFHRTTPASCNQLSAPALTFNSSMTGHHCRLTIVF